MDKDWINGKNGMVEHQIEEDWLKLIIPSCCSISAVRNPSIFKVVQLFVLGNSFLFVHLALVEVKNPLDQDIIYVYPMNI